MAEWTKVIQLTWLPGSDSRADRTVNIFWATGDHGDTFPFDGPGGVIAHTFYPFPVNPESIAGDMHFDNAESCHVGSAVDVFSVALNVPVNPLPQSYVPVNALPVPPVKAPAGASLCSTETSSSCSLTLVAPMLRVRIDTDVAMANEIARYHLNLGDHPHPQSQPAGVSAPLVGLVDRDRMLEGGDPLALLITARGSIVSYICC
jgi:hypothetical protein